MSDKIEIEWPREIWMAERQEHDQGVVSAVLSEHATIARFEGDKERDREFHRYVDGDICDSSDKYWKARLAQIEAERDSIMETLVAARVERIKAITLVERAEKCLSNLCAAYAACNGEDHPAYNAARAVLVDIRGAKQ